MQNGACSFVAAESLANSTATEAWVSEQRIADEQAVLAVIRMSIGTTRGTVRFYDEYDTGGRGRCIGEQHNMKCNDTKSITPSKSYLFFSLHFELVYQVERRTQLGFEVSIYCATHFNFHRAENHFRHSITICRTTIACSAISMPYHQLFCVQRPCKHIGDSRCHELRSSPRKFRPASLWRRARSCIRAA